MDNNSNNIIIKNWAARDKDSSLWFYFEKPEKYSTYWGSDGYCFSPFEEEVFPEIKWEDNKPTELEITFTPKCEK